MIVQQITALLDSYPTGTFSISARKGKPSQISIQYQVGTVLWREAILEKPFDDDQVRRTVQGIHESLDQGCLLPGVAEQLAEHLASEAETR